MDYEILDNLTYIYHSDRGTSHRWPMSEGILKHVLGLPPKLPVDAVPARVLGNVTVYVKSRAQAQADAPRSIRPHRVFAICPQCAHHVPAGRLQQHLKACKAPVAPAPLEHPMDWPHVRALATCPACGAPKDAGVVGMLVCWPCWRRLSETALTAILDRVEKASN